MIINNDFVDQLFRNPIQNGADCLHIVCSIATPTMTAWLMEQIEKWEPSQKISIELVVGSANMSKGFSLVYHQAFQQLVRLHPQCISSFQCSYVYKGTPIHSKLYVWLKQGKPFQAFIGSANFTQSAFLGNIQREVLTECSAYQSEEYYKSIIDDTIYCTHSEIEEYIKLVLPQIPKKNDKTKQVALSLLSSKKQGEVPKISGLNWGQRKGRNPNQAYIPVPISIVRDGFFPVNNTVFTLLTDDHHSLLVRLEQQNNKALTTPSNNALIGEYFRNRLGVAEGAMITKEHLVRYGRTNVVFTKIEDELYYMDFSIGG